MSELIALIMKLFTGLSVLETISTLRMVLEQIEKLLVLLGVQGGSDDVRIVFATSEDREAFIATHFAEIQAGPIRDLIRYFIENPEQLKKFIDLIKLLIG